MSDKEKVSTDIAYFNKLLKQISGPVNVGVFETSKDPEEF